LVKIPLEAREVPKLLFYLALLGVSSYVTVWVAGKIGDQIKTTLGT